jgi:5-methylcytosine-specific restriction enzyme subunit McrC
VQHTIREYGHIAVSGETRGTDFVPVGRVAFDKLREIALNVQEGQKPLLRFAKSRGQETLQVLNYVGVLGIDNGTQLEILPKTSSDPMKASESRALLWQMLNVVTSLKPIEQDEAALHTLPNSWFESLTSLVLEKISVLVRSGIKHDYVRCEERSSFLKGQLQVAKQMRARPGTAHKFHISYDQYLPDRAENRLLKSALRQLNSWSVLLANKRLCREFLFILDDVPESQQIDMDLRRWKNDRGMAHYQPLLPWIKLILANQSPVFSLGRHQGISLLFPMEELFEDYVFKLLRGDLYPGFLLTSQAKSRYLLNHKSKGMFKLIPDGLITQGSTNKAVLDTKWKLLDERLDNTKDKYNLRQSDFYQIFAYGMKYLEGRGELFLIYPSHSYFNQPLHCFKFDEQLSLWAIPFDIKSGKLIFSENEQIPAWHSDWAEHSLAAVGALSTL